MYRFRNFFNGNVSKSTRTKRYGHNVYVNGALAYMVIFFSNISLIYVTATLSIYFIVAFISVILKDYVYKHGPLADAKRCGDIAHKADWYNPYRVSMKQVHLNKSYKYDVK